MTDTTKTPWHVWLVGIILLLWHGYVMFDYMATVFRFEPYLAGYPEEMLEYYFAAPLWMYVLWFIGGAGGLIGAILLLRRNKLVIPVFGAGYVAAIIANLYTTLNPPPSMPVGPEFIIMIFVLAALVLLYCLWLKKKGQLR